MTPREATLARIRAAVGPSPAVPVIPRDYHVHGDLEPDSTEQLFAERVADYFATAHRTTGDALPGVIATVLAKSGTQRVVVPAGLPAGWLAGLAAGVAVVADNGALPTEDIDAADAVVTGCAVAIAETGTVVLDAGGDQGRRVLTLLPDHHVCVVPAERIVATVPEALARLDPRRPLTMISGPSATSDIELSRVEGVHGPRRLDVVVVSVD